MKLTDVIEKGKMDALAFFLSFLPEDKQIGVSLKVADKVVKQVIENECEYLGATASGTAARYWKAYKEMVNILHLTKQYEELKDAYFLLGKIMDEFTFNRYLFEVSAMIHEHHPTYLRQKIALEGVMNNG